MVTVIEAISTIQEQNKAVLAPSTQIGRKSYYKQLTQLSESLNIKEITQELVDVFLKDDCGSAQRRHMHTDLIRRIDKTFSLHLLDLDGYPLNVDPLPNEADVSIFFSQIQFPISSINISFLIVYSAQFIKTTEISDSTFGQYIHAWTLMRSFCQKYYSSEYNSESHLAFLKSNDTLLSSGEQKMWRWKINRKAALVLKEVAETGKYSWHIYQPNPIFIPGDLEDVRLSFIDFIASNNVSKNYINLNDYCFRKLMEGLKCTSKSELLVKKPEDFLESVKTLSSKCSSDSMSTLIPLIRKIIHYLYTNGYIPVDCSGLIQSGHTSSSSLTPYLNSKDVKILIKQLENESLRNKAIVFLLLYLAMRDCDICNLRLENIDWKTEKISFIQQKTGIGITLPLLTEVGNAISDYILHERPECDCPYVFVRTQGPKTKLTTVYSIISKLLKKLDIKTENRIVFGTHLGRYTVTHYLLELNVKHQVITDVLGHTSKESDKSYLSMEDEKLRRCALDCSKIGIITWKAGV